MQESFIFIQDSLVTLVSRPSELLLGLVWQQGLISPGEKTADRNFYGTIIQRAYDAGALRIDQVRLPRGKAPGLRTSGCSPRAISPSSAPLISFLPLYSWATTERRCRRPMDTTERCRRSFLPWANYPLMRNQPLGSFRMKGFSPPRRGIVYVE